MQAINFYNIKIGPSKSSNQVVVRGEIENKSGKNYNAVAIRIILFIKSTPIANSVLVVNGLFNGMTKSFDKYIEGLRYDKVGKDIDRQELYVESTY